MTRNNNLKKIKEEINETGTTKNNTKNPKDSMSRFFKKVRRVRDPWPS